MPDHLPGQAGERLSDEAIRQVMGRLSPEALRALHAVSQMRNRPPEEVLREELKGYIADKLPPVDIEGIIHAMAERFYAFGYFCGTAKRWLREWNENHR